MKKQKKVRKKVSLEEIERDWKSLIIESFKKNKLSFFLGLATFFLINLILVLSLSFGVRKNKTSIDKFRNQPIKEKEKPIIYEVRPGDTLSGIAQKFYGDMFLIQPLIDANGIKEINLIEVGQRLIIPSLKDLPKKNQTQNVLSANEKKKYKVKPGDTLWKIALEFYGDGYQWPKIIQRNNLTTDKIEVGQELEL